MSLFHIPLEQIQETDLKALIDNKVRESRTIEYKEKLPSTPEENERFCFTVCSFANTAGGDVLFGVKERREGEKPTGEPETIFPLSDNFDSERLRLLQLIKSNLEPRISGCRIEAIAVTGGYVCIVRIPKSWVGLQAVRRNEAYRFYHRTSAGRSTMDMTEIRAGFAAAVEGYDRLHNIRLKRIAMIRENRGPVDLQEGPLTILHIIPLSVMNPTIQFDVKPLEIDYGFLPIRHTASWNDRYTFDGILRYSLPEVPSTRSYVQFFRNGIVEACSVGLVASPAEGKRLYVQEIEASIRKALPAYLNTLKKLGATHPSLLSLTLVKVKDFALTVSSYTTERVTPFREDDLIVPEILIENDETQLDSILRPAFDRIWNAAGLSGSLSYDEEGNWKPGR